jgi:hypothetical protein
MKLVKILKHNFVQIISPVSLQCISMTPSLQDSSQLFNNNTSLTFYSTTSTKKTSSNKKKNSKSRKQVRFNLNTSMNGRNLTNGSFCSHEKKESVRSILETSKTINNNKKKFKKTNTKRKSAASIIIVSIFDICVNMNMLFSL